MKLSVVIVNYNVRYFLEQCLSSVFAAAERMNAHDPAFTTEVWVVDNNSNDSSIEMVKSRFPAVKIIANKENRGFSFANNQAIRQSAGEYVLLLNPDTLVKEDTFLKTVLFMDSRPQAGGLGVKMLDGKGNFLPESKRGFPSPAVAFYKIFGFSKFFPKSKSFGKYHLGYLNKEQINEIDVLSGAFMCLRKAVLDKVGLLDETFFMYGEDIDLSYRIVKGGYKNYYFPETSIIHYKGESTKKSSINYVFVFYKAMVIFARKHLPKQTAGLFAVLIHLAIYLRAGAAIVFRILKRLLLPAVDFLLIYGGMILLVRYWERTIKYVKGGYYPDELLNFFVPIYILLWLLGVFIAGGYQKPYLGKKIFRGVLIGTVILSLFYAFLDEAHRYSRALIILGAALSVVVLYFTRVVAHFLKERSLKVEAKPVKKVLIAASKPEFERVVRLLEKSSYEFSIIGYVSRTPEEQSVGSFENLRELVSIYRVDELIFCLNDVSYAEVIESMEQLSDCSVEFRTVAADSKFVIGSSSKNTAGDFYSYEETPSIIKPESRFNKRFFDITASLGLIATLPFNVWFIRNASGYFKNIWNVLRGKKSWVGLTYPDSNIKAGVLSPVDELPFNNLDTSTKKRLDVLYARDYTIYKDISIFLQGFSKLGREQSK